MGGCLKSLLVCAAAVVVAAVVVLVFGDKEAARREAEKPVYWRVIKPAWACVREAEARESIVRDGVDASALPRLPTCLLLDRNTRGAVAMVDYGFTLSRIRVTALDGQPMVLWFPTDAIESYTVLTRDPAGSVYFKVKGKETLGCPSVSQLWRPGASVSQPGCLSVLPGDTIKDRGQTDGRYRLVQVERTRTGSPPVDLWVASSGITDF